MIFSSHHQGTIPHHRGNPGAHPWSSPGFPQHPRADYLSRDKPPSKSAQAPDSLYAGTPRRGLQLDIGAAIPSS